MRYYLNGFIIVYLHTVVSVCSWYLCLPPSVASGCSEVASFLKGVMIIDNVDDLSQGCLVKSIQKCPIILLGPAVKTRTKGSFINREEDKQRNTAGCCANKDLWALCAPIFIIAVGIL